MQEAIICDRDSYKNYGSSWGNEHGMNYATQIAYNEQDTEV